MMYRSSARCATVTPVPGEHVGVVRVVERVLVAALAGENRRRADTFMYSFC